MSSVEKPKVMGSSYEFDSELDREELRVRIEKVGLAKFAKARGVNVKEIDWKSLKTVADVVECRISLVGSGAIKKGSRIIAGTDMLSHDEFDVVLEPKSEWMKYLSRSEKIQVVCERVKREARL